MIRRAFLAFNRRRDWDQAELRAWRLMGKCFEGGFLYIDPNTIRSRTLDQLHVEALYEHACRILGE